MYVYMIYNICISLYIYIYPSIHICMSYLHPGLESMDTTCLGQLRQGGMMISSSQKVQVPKHDGMSQKPLYNHYTHGIWDLVSPHLGTWAIWGWHCVHRGSLLQVSKASVSYWRRFVSVPKMGGPIWGPYFIRTTICSASSSNKNSRYGNFEFQQLAS